MSLNAIINRFSGQKRETVLVLRREVVERIAKEYALEQQYNAQEKLKVIDPESFEKGFSKGYKQGYNDHSDEEYNRAMFVMWQKHVADKTEKNATFDNERLEIVEPPQHEIINN